MLKMSNIQFLCKYENTMISSWIISLYVIPKTFRIVDATFYYGMVSGNCDICSSLLYSVYNICSSMYTGYLSVRDVHNSYDRHSGCRVRVCRWHVCQLGEQMFHTGRGEVGLEKIGVVEIFLTKERDLNFFQTLKGVKFFHASPANIFNKCYKKAVFIKKKK